MLLAHNYHKYFYPYSAGIDFSCENLTSTDVRLKVDPRSVKVNAGHKGIWWIV